MKMTFAKKKKKTNWFLNLPTYQSQPMWPFVPTEVIVAVSWTRKVHEDEWQQRNTKPLTEQKLCVTETHIG